MPARLGDIARASKHLDLGVALRKGKGSHFVFERPGYRCYPVPAGNGEKTEIGDQYIRGLCRALGLDEQQLRKLL
jgi:hypothetical protein